MVRTPADPPVLRPVPSRVRVAARFALGAVVALAFAPASVASQTLTGRVLAPDGPVEAAEILVGAEPVALTGPEGAFRAGVAPGSHTVRVRALGYSTAERRVEVSAGETVRLEIRVEMAAVPVDPLVVTGTMRESRVSDSPVKVDVVSARLLERVPARSLVESIELVNGLYEQVDCGVCYTNSIRINGMEGPYTAVLVDGMPIMGALAAVYGLNGIDPALIERLEILKGPQSTLYGTEAMGGVVNVITKDPRFTPRWSVETARSSLDETTVKAGASAVGPSFGAMVSGSFLHNDRFIDDNGDGFSDLTLDQRLSLFGKAALYREGREWLEASAKVYRESRFGGVEEWTEAHRGSDRVYGESVETRRVEAMARVSLLDRLTAAASLSWHDQDSWYGDQPFAATQGIAYGQVVWNAPPLGGHDVLVGATLRARRYDDDTPATATAERRLVPGLFVQDEWNAGRGWTFLAGLRADHHREHGLITSPRAAVKLSPWPETTFRLNAGTGFRVVNLFTEDHAALTGSREVVIVGNLRPERSWSVAFNANQVVRFGANPMMIDLDVFHTRFANQIRPDYDVHPDRIVYANLDGHAVTRGIALSLNQNFHHLPLLYTAGVTFQDVFAVEDGRRKDHLFSPRWRGVFSASWTFPGELTLDWSGRVVGPMRLPEYEEPFARPTRSEVHSVHTLQARWRAAGGVELRAAVENLFDFTQGSPLVDPGDPFGPAFDTNYAWGPVVGRTFTVGVRVAGSR